MNLRIDEEVILAFKELGVEEERIGTYYVLLMAYYRRDKALIELLVTEEIIKSLIDLDLLKNENKLTIFGSSLCEELAQEAETVESWVNEYRNLWIDPETGSYYKTPDKRSLGASVKDLTTKLKAFIQIYNDSFNDMPRDMTVKSVILQATKNYIDEFKKVRFAYCKDAYNFIFKQEGKTRDTTRSLLATACENLIISKTTTIQQTEKRTKSINF